MTVRWASPPHTFLRRSLSLPGDPPPYPVGPRPVTGRRHPRLDGPQKVTGRAVYTHDARRPGMLHARILRSPHAHAKIVSIDASAAERMPGVVIENPGKDMVRYHGEAVLALAAPTRAAAEDALRAVKVAYDVLPHTVSLAAARKDGAPLVFQKPVEEKRSAGDEPGAAAKLPADGQRARAEGLGQGRRRQGLRRGRGHARGRHDDVRPDARLHGDALDVRRVGRRHARGPGLDAGHVQREGRAAEVFKLSKDKVIVRAEFTGGGFGSKFGARDYGVLAAKLAKKAGKPVLMALDRKEDQLSSGNRPDSWNRVKLGYRKDGTVTAVDYESFGTAGVATGTGTGGFVKSAYGFPAVKVAESDVFTHLGPGCAMRAPGHPQGCFAVETALEELGDRSGWTRSTCASRTTPPRCGAPSGRSGAKEIGWSRRAEISKANAAAAAAGNPSGAASAARRPSGTRSSRPARRSSCASTATAASRSRTACRTSGAASRTPIAMVVAEELGLPVGSSA